MESRWIILGSAAYLFCMLVVLNGCSSPTGKEKPPVEKPAPATYTVEIVQMKFFPAELKVKKGDQVVFVNRDLVMHDVTEESRKAWNSSPLATGQDWALVATESVNYYCSLHPVMKGRIIVE